MCDDLRSEGSGEVGDVGDGARVWPDASGSMLASAVVATVRSACAPKASCVSFPLPMQAHNWGGGERPDADRAVLHYEDDVAPRLGGRREGEAQELLLWLDH